MKNLLLLILLTLNLFAKKEQLSLAGEWYYHVENEPQSANYVYRFEGGEKKMKVPSNWYSEGVNHAGVMWFQKIFSGEPFLKSKKHFLEFQGVDYLCDVWLNENYLGSHKGYFQKFEFDISDILKDGENILKVKVNSPLENYPENYSLHKTLLRGLFSHHDTRAGGAWSPKGQDRNSGGIWNAVTIKSYNEYKIEKFRVTPTIQEDSVHIDMELLVHRLNKRLFNFKEQLDVTISPKNFEGESFQEEFKVEIDKKASLSMELKGAKLWRTHDRGFPYLYDITLKIGEYRYTLTTGFKSFQQNSNRVHFLNNVPLFIKGTNYISSQYMSEMNEAKIRADLELMKKAHINAIRVHAHIEPQYFYKLCDEMGFLVWQDYNLQWGYIESEAFEREAVKQALEMVEMLYNHPSIYIWSMHNEPPWDSPWMKWKYEDYNNKQNQKLDEKLYQAVKGLDGFHLVQKISAAIEHPWFGWYSGQYEDFKNPSKSMIITEYGAQAIVSKNSLQKFIPKKYLLPKSKKAKKIWKYHNFQFDIANKYGVKFKGDLDKFIEDSQNYQAKLIKYATEMLRIQKYKNSSAIFQFMFKEGWESMNWGIVDYYNQPKPAYYKLKKAFEPIIIVAKQSDENMLDFYLVNDTLAEIRNVEAQIIVDKKSFSFPLTLQKDSVLKFAKMPLKRDSTIELKLINKTKTIASNRYEFSIIKNIKEK